MPEPKPYVIKRDGAMVYRDDQEHIIGQVWLGKDGWYATNPHHQFGPNYTKWTVAREAWEDWQKILAEHRAKKKEDR